MRTARWMLNGVPALVFVASAQAAGGEGLIANPDHIPWARWQMRISVGSVTPAAHVYGWAGQDASGLKPQRFSLMGDYYFSTALTPPGSGGGFRATSGFIVGSATQAWIDQPGLAAGRAISLANRYRRTNPPSLPDDAATGTRPYLGIGYTGLSTRGGWSFSADLGLTTLPVRFGRALNGASLDAAILDMRFAPILQFGVSYSF